MATEKLPTQDDQETELIVDLSIRLGKTQHVLRELIEALGHAARHAPSEGQGTDYWQWIRWDVVREAIQRAETILKEGTET